MLSVTNGFNNTTRSTHKIHKCIHNELSSTLNQHVYKTNINYPAFSRRGSSRSRKSRKRAASEAYYDPNASNKYIIDIHNVSESQLRSNTHKIDISSHNDNTLQTARDGSTSRDNDHKHKSNRHSRKDNSGNSEPSHRVKQKKTKNNNTKNKPTNTGNQQYYY